MTLLCQGGIIQTTISLPKLQLELNITHFNIYTTSLIHHLCTWKIPSRTVSLKIITYIHLKIWTYCVFILKLLNSKFVHYLPLTINLTCANSILHVTCQYKHYHTFSYPNILIPKGFKKNRFQRSLAFCVIGLLQEWHLLHPQNVIPSHQEHHPWNFFLFRLITFSQLFLRVSCQVVISHFQ